MHKFDEQHQAFEGFSEFYEATVKSNNKENTSSSFVLWMFFEDFPPNIRRIIIFLLGIISLSVFISFIFQVDMVITMIGLTFLSVFIYIIYDAYKYPIDTKCHYEFIAKLASFVDLQKVVGPAPPLLLWRGLGLLPSHQSQNVIHLNLSGEYNGCAIKFMYVKSYIRNEGNLLPQRFQKVIFDGHLIRLDIPKPFSGKTIILRDQGIGQPKTSYGMKKIGLVDPVFEKVFEVYGSDQVESRALLSPDFMQDIIALENISQGKHIEFGFIAGQLLISVSKPTLDVREALDKNLYDRTLAQSLINEISHVFDIIDVITKPNR